MAERDGAAEAPVPEGFRPLESHAPFGALVGPLYEKVDGERFWRGFRVLEKHANRVGISHGGMLMTFADILLAQAIWRAGVAPAVTVRMVTDFTASARVGEWVQGSARMTRTAGSLVFVDGAITAEGRPVMTATGIFQRIRPRG